MYDATALGWTDATDNYAEVGDLSRKHGKFSDWNGGDLSGEGSLVFYDANLQCVGKLRVWYGVCNVPRI